MLSLLRLRPGQACEFLPLLYLFVDDLLVSRESLPQKVTITVISQNDWERVCTPVTAVPTVQSSAPHHFSWPRTRSVIAQFGAFNQGQQQSHQMCTPDFYDKPRKVALAGGAGFCNECGLTQIFVRFVPKDFVFLMLLQLLFLFQFLIIVVNENFLSSLSSCR